MEHGSLTDPSSSTFSVIDEDHTLANAVRFVLNQNPRVTFTGYSIPHPSDNVVNIRVQTTGDSAKDVLKDSLNNLVGMCEHVRSTFDRAVADFKETNPTKEEMEVDQFSSTRQGVVGALSSFSNHPSLTLNRKPRYSLPNGGAFLRFSNFISTHHHPLRSHSGTSTTRASSLELPLLPFTLGELLIPSEAKTLHLYEARFLALLEEAVTERNKTFVHFVLDPVSNSQSSFASYCCLIHIENIERLPIGALVSIRGISRVNVVELVQMEPYLRGVVVPVLDHVSNETIRLDSKILELWDSISSLQALQIKLKVPKGERLQTQTKNSLVWAQNEIYDFLLQDFVPTLAERISFAAFQPVSGMSDSELLALQREKLKAMDMKDSLERIEDAIEFVRQCSKMVAARLAIQSL